MNQKQVLCVLSWCVLPLLSGALWLGVGCGRRQQYCRKPYSQRKRPSASATYREISDNICFSWPWSYLLDQVFRSSEVMVCSLLYGSEHTLTLCLLLGILYLKKATHKLDHVWRKGTRKVKSLEETERFANVYSWEAKACGRWDGT